jgi:hypothetical protein
VLACAGGGIKKIQKPDGQVTTCSYGGKTYNPGDSFRQDCNTCACGSNGQVGCTLMQCSTDAGSELAADAAPPDAQADGTVPLDQAKDVKPTIDVAANLSPDRPAAVLDAKPTIDVMADMRVPAAADSAQDLPLVADTANDSPLAVDAKNVGDGSRQSCLWEGDMVLAIGQSIPAGDGCHTCTCTLAGMDCTASTCEPPSDAAALVCSLWNPLIFGWNGGKVSFQDSYSLEGTQLAVTRNYFSGGMDGPTVRSCSPTLPKCGASGVVSVSTIVQDLADGVVQLVLSHTYTNTYGVDRRASDGQVWSISRPDGGTILVGDPCPAPTAWCQPILPAIQLLADDLKSLASAMLASPECSGL